jgi:hypothetical protein
MNISSDGHKRENGLPVAPRSVAAGIHEHLCDEAAEGTAQLRSRHGPGFESFLARDHVLRLQQLEPYLHYSETERISLDPTTVSSANPSLLGSSSVSLQFPGLPPTNNVND